MSSPLLMVIVLNCNGMRVIRECLASLRQSTYPNFSIVVSDNASTDGSPGWVEQHHPDIKVIRNSENLGWSGANNVGIRHALERGADWIWMLNNDVEVEPDCIDQMVRFGQEHPEFAILGPLIHYFEPRDRVWFEGGRTDFETLVADHCSYAEFSACPQEERYISGCAQLVRSDVFRRIGLIDERFFIYFEDTDFCRRAGLAGFTMDVVRSAKMYHKVSAFSGGIGERSPWKAYYMLRSGLLFWRKHLGWWAFHRRYCHGHLAKWINDLDREWSRNEGRAYVQAVLDALWYFVAGRNEPRGHPACPGWFRKGVLRRPWLVAELMAFRMKGLLGSR
ncbi:MAG: glycosyltransferase family 2 protein [bacterium]